MWREQRSSRVAAALRIRELANSRRGSARAVGSPGAVVDEALTALLNVVPYDCAMIARWDPCGRSHSTLGSVGYPPGALRTFEAVPHRETPRQTHQRARSVTRLSDIPTIDRDGPVFRDVIQPLGFSDGLSLCLATGHRCVGVIHASVARGVIDNDGLAILEMLASDLAAIVDILPPPVAAWLASGGVEESVGIVAWDRTNGDVVGLNGSAQPALLGPTSPLPEALLALGSRGNGRVTVLAGCNVLLLDVTSREGWMLIEHQAAAPPAGLTIRELEVLNELAAGRSNREAAAALAASEWTIVTHVEHILHKLCVPNRTAAAVEATRLGLVRVPAGRWFG